METLSSSVSSSSSSSSSSFYYDEFYSTFLASLRSVGTACTLAAVGVYLHRQGYVVGDGKRSLALISQQVTIPLFLFTKLINCNQDWSNQPCPDVIQSLADVWMLLIWPAYVVLIGLLVGWVMAKLSHTPSDQIRAVLAACAFGNSTGLPITLLTVVHDNFPQTSNLGRMDPNLFLSVYLLLYPILQWGAGGWLLVPEEEDDGDNDDSNNKRNNNRLPSSHHHHHQQQQQHQPYTETSLELVQRPGGRSTPPPSSPLSNSVLLTPKRLLLARNVLNNRTTATLYKLSRRGITETDASLYMSVQDNLNHYGQLIDTPEDLHANDDDDDDDDDERVSTTTRTTTRNTIPSESIGLDVEGDHDGQSDDEFRNQLPTTTVSANKTPTNTTSYIHNPPLPNATVQSTLSSATMSSPNYQEETIWATMGKIAGRALQPPVVAAIVGMVIAATPLRNVFVDTVDRDSDAPLEWLFDGLHEVGLAAVPLNMMILGCNLSASASHLGIKSEQQQEQQHQHQHDQLQPSNADTFSSATMAAIVIGKMVVCPLVGFLSTSVLRNYILDIPDGKVPNKK